MGIKQFFKSHDNVILAGISIAGTVGAVIAAWNARPKCESILEEKKDASNWEKVTAVAPSLLPVIGATAVSIGATVWNAKSNAGKIAKLASTAASAVTVAQTAKTAHDAYEKATREVVGEEKEQEIRKKQVKTMAESKPVVMDDVYDTGTGTFIFREPFTGVTVRASKAFILSSVLESRDEVSKVLEGSGKRRVRSFRDIIMKWNVPYEKIPDCADLVTWDPDRGQVVNVDLSETFEYNGAEPGYIVNFFTGIAGPSMDN